MSVIDGGSFKCDQHDQRFETTDPQVWHEHMNDGNHSESGEGVCAVCGTKTFYEHKIIGKKPLCDKCREDLLNQ
jgi:hypothetical protein